MTPPKPEQEDFWRNYTAEMGDVVIPEVAPVSLRVDEIPENPADLMHALVVNRTVHRLPEEKVDLAMQFIGDLFLTADAKAAVTDLPIALDDDGNLVVELQFPSLRGVDG